MIPHVNCSLIKLIAVTHALDELFVKTSLFFLPTQKMVIKGLSDKPLSLWLSSEAKQKCGMGRLKLFSDPHKSEMIVIEECIT